MGSAVQRVAVAMKLLTPLKGFKKLQFVCLQTQWVFCSMKPSAWGLFGVSGGFWFFEIFFPRFFPPRFGESLGTFWAKKSFRENPVSNGFDFFVYCLPQEKRISLFFWSSNFRRFETCCHFFLRNLTCILYTNKWGLGKGISFHGNFGYSTSENWRVYKYILIYVPNHQWLVARSQLEGSECQTSWL